MAWLIGLKECPFRIPDPEAAGFPAGLSPSQKRAWLAATCADNPLVLVQGPPGTGKTFVLERSASGAEPAKNAVRSACRSGKG